MTWQDLVVPSFKWPYHYAQSPMLGKPQRTRDVLLYFRVRAVHVMPGNGKAVMLSSR